MIGSNLPATTHDTAAASSKKTVLKRVLGVGLGLFCAAIAGMAVYGTHGQAFQHGNERFLMQLASASGVHVTFTPKTGSEDAPSSNAIEGFLFPRTLSNGTLTFDGRISYVHVGSQYNFTLLDGRGYVTVADESSGSIITNDCLIADNIPPISTFTDALLDARVVDDASDFKVSCSAGNLVEFIFADEPYVFCSDSNSTATSIVGEDLSAAFELFYNNSDDFPTLDSLTRPQGLDITKCELLEDLGDSSSAGTVSTSSRKLMEKTVRCTKEAYQVLTGTPRRSLSSSCGCSTKKVCLFVHGLGYDDGETTDSFSDYFGSIDTDAKCCSSTKFIHLDTVGTAWYDDALTDKLCAVAAEVSNSANSSLSNLAIVAHSMGNLVTASALTKGTCALASSSQWIALNGPMYGSMSSTTSLTLFDSLSPSLQAFACSETLAGTLSNPIFSILASFGLCPSQVSMKSISYMGTATSNSTVDALYVKAAATFKAQATSNMCGVSYVGLVSTDSAKLTVIGLLSGHATSANDGEVEISSCHATKDLSTYSTSYDGGNFYKASINHLDGAFRHGDGWWGSARKPVKWFNCQFQ